MNKKTVSDSRPTGDEIAYNGVREGEPLSTLDIARLELIGARQRLKIAERELQDFLEEHAGVAVPAYVRQSLAREEEALQTELDAAIRRHKECLAQFEELQDRDRAMV
jgi:hypothetical protein